VTAHAAHLRKAQVEDAVPFDIYKRQAAERAHAEGARALIRTRQAMAKRFPMEAFRDHAWDVLLDLYMRELEQRETCVKQAILSAHMSSTSAMRLIERLEGAGFIVRIPDTADHRRMIVQLTELGRSTINAMLDSLFPEKNS
jgi:DNA-binding MarR family transcriptional regulator